MRKTDIAYMAGFFDGEGCITLYKTRGIYSLHVDICQCNEHIIKWFQFCFGGTIHTRYENHHKFKKQWRWHTSGGNAMGFLKTIIPYLVLKKAEAELAIKFQSRRANKIKFRRSDEEKALDEAARILMHNLKDKTNLEVRNEIKISPK